MWTGGTGGSSGPRAALDPQARAALLRPADPPSEPVLECSTNIGIHGNSTSSASPAAASSSSVPAAADSSRPPPSLSAPSAAQAAPATLGPSDREAARASSPPPPAGHSRAGAEDGRPVRRRARTAFRFQDQRFRPMDIHGLKYREFEVDLLFGEIIARPPIRVRLTKTVTFARRAVLWVFTLGLYEVWVRFLATGGHIFDLDSRLAVTSFGRLLLWTHSADGGSQPLLEHLVASMSRPPALAMLALLCAFVAFGPITLGIHLGLAAGVVGGILLGSFIAALLDWLFERASLTVHTSVRQFEARELSCVRMQCCTLKRFWGLGGEVTICQAHFFFGRYPWEWQLGKTLNSAVYDSGTVKVGNAAVPEEGPSVIAGTSGLVQSQGLDVKSPSGFIGFCSAILVALAFAAFFTEVVDFVSQWVQCVQQNPDATLAVWSVCVSEKFRSWWLGGGGASPQTVAAHWIEAGDWSLQIVLFFYIFAPAVSFLWGTSDQSSAGLGFVVDRTFGSATEDESFDEHWEELSLMVAELFHGACGCSEIVHSAGSMERIISASKPDWTEVVGDIATPRPCGPPIVGRSSRVSRVSRISLAQASRAARAVSFEDGAFPTRESLADGRRPPRPGATFRHAKPKLPPLPRSSWKQMEDMMTRIIEPLSRKVRVYTGALCFQPDEKVLAVYPETVRMSFFVKVKILFTCGLEYFLHWRRQRREGAIILTDKRLIQASTYTSLYYRSAKVDMYTMGATVKLVALRPPMKLCCIFPPGWLAIATHRGTLEVKLLRIRRLMDCAKQLWKGLALLQDAPSVAAVEFNDFVTVVDSDEEREDADDLEGPDDLETPLPHFVENVQRAARESLGWGGIPDVVSAIRREQALLGSEVQRPSRTSAALQGRPSSPEAAEAGEVAAAIASNAGASVVVDSATGTGGDGVPARDSAASNHSQASSKLSQTLDIGIQRAESWGLVLADGERVLWGPCLFEEEVLRPVCCPNRRRKTRNWSNPTCLVTITDCRLVVMQIRTMGPVWFPLCQRIWVGSIAAVPLRWVLGFCIEESFSMQQAQLTRLFGQVCMRPLSVSSIVVRVMTDAGFGKAYLECLYMSQRVLPRVGDPPCYFEADKVLDLRRWLGNVSLFFGEGTPGTTQNRPPIELWRGPRGLTPAWA